MCAFGLRELAHTRQLSRHFSSKTDNNDDNDDHDDDGNNKNSNWTRWRIHRPIPESPSNLLYGCMRRKQANEHAQSQVITSCAITGNVHQPIESVSHTNMTYKRESRRWLNTNRASIHVTSYYSNCIFVMCLPFGSICNEGVFLPFLQFYTIALAICDVCS